eukprot:8766038-Pyramimonas_sp.AAC.1
MSSCPDAMRAVRNARESVGMTPHPLTKKPKGEDDDLDTSPILHGFYRPYFSLPRTKHRYNTRT